MSVDDEWAADPACVVDVRQKMRQVRPVLLVWHGGDACRNNVARELAAATHVFCASRSTQRPTTIALSRAVYSDRQAKQVL